MGCFASKSLARRLSAVCHWTLDSLDCGFDCLLCLPKIEKIGTDAGLPMPACIKTARRRKGIHLDRSMLNRTYYYYVASIECPFILLV